LKEEERLILAASIYLPKAMYAQEDLNDDNDDGDSSAGALILSEVP
jgi:hypothetical protein